MLLGTFARPAATASLAAALPTIRVVGLRVDPDAMRLLVALDLPSASAAPRASEPPLTPAQVSRWEARLDQWDGFLSFVVKNLASEHPDAGVRDELLGLLLEARRELVAVLARGPVPGTDAVRSIFLRTLGSPGVIVGPGAAARPRRARSATLLPVRRRRARDHRCRRPAAALDFLGRWAAPTGPEPRSPVHRRSTGALRRTRSALAGAVPLPNPDAPPRRPRRTPPGTTWTALPRHAHAADGDTEWQGLAARLDRWVPVNDELPDYRATVDRCSRWRPSAGSIPMRSTNGSTSSSPIS